MTDRIQRLGCTILTCAAIVGCGLARDAAAQTGPKGPPANPDGRVALAVVYNDGGAKIVKSERVVAELQKRVDFYLLNLGTEDVTFAVTFSKEGAAEWVCEENQPSSSKNVARNDDDAISCKVSKAVADRICKRTYPCLVDFAYKVTKKGTTDVIVADPQLEIRR